MDGRVAVDHWAVLGVAFILVDVGEFPNDLVYGVGGGDGLAPVEGVGECHLGVDAFGMVCMIYRES